MLHEILFAMLGKLGNAIIETETAFKVNPSLNFISKSETALIEKLIILGFYYRKLKKIVDEDSKSFSNRILNFNDRSKNDEQFDLGAIGNSAYVRAVCNGVTELLKEYERQILQVEQDFLKDKIFTFSSLCVKFSKFYSVFPECLLMFERVEEDSLKGGPLIDYLYQCSLNGNSHIKEHYSRLLENCYGMMYNQTMLWILHGKLFDKFDEFFIYRLSRTEEFEKNETGILDRSKQEEKSEDWDGIYSMRYSLLPKYLISQKTAEKILFIGKSVRVLNSAENGNSKIFSKEIIDVIKNAGEFNFLNFQIAIEKVRAHVATQFLRLFLDVGNIREHLLNLRNYYLLGKGEFFHVFIEESEQLFQFPPSRYASHDINNKVFQNSLIRLNWMDNPIVKRIKFFIRINGFDYSNFGSLIGLNINGSVEQKVNAIRFKATKRGKCYGGLWHSLKQNIENGFEMRTTVRFRRAISSISINGVLPDNHLVPPEFEDFKDEFISSNIAAFVIQNLKEINNWKRKSPGSLSDLSEYLAVKVGFLERDITKASSLSTEKYYPYILVEYFSSSGKLVKSGQAVKSRVVLASRVLDLLEVNFSEQEIHKIRVVYNRKSIAVYLWRGDNEGVPLIDLRIDLQKYLHFDMGRAFVGFIPDGYNSSFNMDLLKWSMEGFNVFNSADPWNGLTLKYINEWPNNLVLSDQILERYSNLFRLLFPIKTIQWNLHQCWCTLNNQIRHNPDEKLFTYVSNLRNKMSFMIDNIWSYFHLDVLEVQWTKLNKSLDNLAEFEDLRKAIKRYLESIYIQTFLNFPEIIRNLFRIVEHCKKYCSLIKRIEAGELVYDVETDLLDLQRKFDESVSRFIRLINHLNQAGSSQFLSQLLTRLNFNNYYETLANEDELGF